MSVENGEAKEKREINENGGEKRMKEKIKQYTRKWLI